MLAIHPELGRLTGLFAGLFTGLLCLALGLAPATAQSATPASAPMALSAAPEGAPEHAALEFDTRAARHLLNRAGFGGTAEEVRRAVEQGLAATLDELFAAPSAPPPSFEAHNLLVGGVLGRAGLDGADSEAIGARMGVSDGEPSDARRREALLARTEDRRQLETYTRWWLEGMVLGEEALRDRMTLFWHGHFTSSMQSVRNGHALIRQHTMLREQALGDFRTLLGAVLRDPAMLVYLDNVRNRRGRPNENLARELFELFTLGEGNYTEEDVKEAARALTGHAAMGGAYLFAPGRHDPGVKRILGRQGRFRAEDLVNLVLEQPACAVHLARRLLVWFEGVEPPEDRLTHYAELLRSLDYHFEPFLRALFSDPEFYGERVVGARIAAPVDLLIGQVRRLGVEPPERFLENGTRVLGQHLFHPPSVKGWDGDEGWISTSTLMLRGNIAGVLVGAIGLAEVLGFDAPEPTGRMGQDGTEQDGRPARVGQRPRLAQLAGRDPGMRGLSRLERTRWRSPVRFSRDLRALGVVADAEVIQHLTTRLLAIEPPPETLAELEQYLRASREEFSIPEERMTSWGTDGEALLRRLAHRILALPEAQLH